MLLLLPEGIRSSELGYTLLFLLDNMSSCLLFLSTENNYYLLLNIEREKKES